MSTPTNDAGADSGAGAPRPSLTNLPIIWFALLASVGIYAVVGLVVAPLAAPALAPEQLNLFLMVFALLAMTQSGVAMMVPRILPRLPFFTQHILRWALAESIAVFGLVLRFLGGSTLYFLSFLGWSALLLLTLRPGQEKRI